MTISLAYIGLGSNLAEPEQQLQQALFALAHLTDSQLMAYSSLYYSKALGGLAQPDYVNAVAVLHTHLSPHNLLTVLQNIENQQGRERTERWGARTLDLDMLLYDNLQMQDSRLTLPHPEMLNRAFVLIPLAECVTDLVLPQGIYLSTAIKQCPSMVLSKGIKLEILI